MMITGAPGERSKAGCTAGRPERGRRNERGEDGAPVEDGRRPFLLQCRGQLRSQSGLVGGLAEQDRAGVADSLTRRSSRTHKVHARSVPQDAKPQLTAIRAVKQLNIHLTLNSGD